MTLATVLWKGAESGPLPSKNVSVLRAALVFALLISACRSGPPTEGWIEVARASGVVPNQSGVTECRWDLPCQQVESGVFSTTGRPLRLVCTGRVDLLFVEYFHGPEPHSGNGWLCPSEGTSSILLLPPRSRASLYLAAARVPPRDAGEDRLPWSLSVQEWKGLWRKPDCHRDRRRVPSGLWAICGDGPTGFAIPAPTPPG